jgi:hypothetical protein
MTVSKFWRVLPYDKCILAGESLTELKDYIVEWYMVADVSNVEF